MKRTDTWPSAVVMTLLAFGLMIVWGLLAGWTISLCGNYGLFGSGERVLESLEITIDGKPLITSRAINNYNKVSWRTLDGQSVEIEQERWLGGAYLPLRPQPMQWFHSPLKWPDRVGGNSDHQREPTNWYLIRDAEPEGHAFFVRFDPYSKAQVGYVGRKGFRATTPPPEEQFDLGPIRLSGFVGTVCGRSLQFYGLPNSYGVEEGNPISNWAVYMIDEDRLLEIDLRKRSVRTLRESPDMISVGILTGMELLEDSSEEVKRGIFSRLAIRTTDGVILFDPPTGNQHEFSLPKELAEAAISVYSLEALELWVTSAPTWQTNKPFDLLRITTEGEITERHTIHLASPSGPTMRQGFLIAAIVVPALIVWVVLGLTLGPIGYLQQNAVSNNSETLSEILTASWPALLFVVVLSIIVAWLVFRIHRRYHRSHTALWCGAAFFLSVPGLVAYRLHYGRPVTERCASCGKTAPRDRDACAACGDAFAGPALGGAEVFA